MLNWMASVSSFLSHIVWRWYWLLVCVFFSPDSSVSSVTLICVMVRFLGLGPQSWVPSESENRGFARHFSHGCTFGDWINTDGDSWIGPPIAHPISCPPLSSTTVLSFLHLPPVEIPNPSSRRLPCYILGGHPWLCSYRWASGLYSAGISLPPPDPCCPTVYSSFQGRAAPFSPVAETGECRWTSAAPGWQVWRHSPGRCLD